VACIRLGDAGDEATIRASAAALRPICRAQDIPLLLETHFRLARDLRLDGVHLTDGARQVRAARKALGAEATVGAFCGASRHAGMTAGEAGADYVAFGPVGATALGTGELAEPALFAWWAEMIELPVVAEAGLTAAAAARVARDADFLAIGPEIWWAEDPVAALRAIWPFGAGEPV
jgi:thiamine-phosphate pyrophosphorylase